MAISIAVAVCLAYIVGLLCTGLEIGQLQIWQVSLPVAGLGVAVLFVSYAGFAPQAWKLGWRSQQWLGLAGIFLLATLYMSWRSPAPDLQDISRYVERAQAIAPTHVITGRVIDEPRLNRGLKSRFRIAVKRLEVEDDEGKPTFQIPVRGRLYVTAPLLQATGLHAGQPVTAQGRLYLPQAALNPNGFDFQAYLTSRGTFAGLVADELIFAERTGWGLWRVRQRLVKAQVRALGSPLGQLVSAMALGRKAVDLPFDIQDLFARVGLAHTVAASGFHVSLLLGAVLALLRSRSGKVQLIVGLVVLTGYVILTGAQASVLRAAFMGSAALLGIALERQVKPLGALLTAVTLMLLMNPNWIWDIGFQLSVVATVGLIVMVPTLTQRLDWLPITLASLLAVPIAATLWTLPLLLYHFNVVSSISIALNVVVTPLVTVISLGGIGSSAVALVLPTMGSLLAHLLYYPVQLLFWLANAASQLPGSSIAIGQITRWQLAGLYLVLIVGMMNLRQQFWQRSLPAVFLGLLLIPLGWQWWAQNQITVLATGNDLIWVRQAHGHTTLINSGTEKTAFYTVQPFLQQAGINHLDAAIAPSLDETTIAGWQTLLQNTPSAKVYGSEPKSPLSDRSAPYQPLQVGQSNAVDDLTLQPLGTENPILRVTTPQQTWLLLPELSLDLQDYLASAGSVLQSDVLVWPGEELSETLLTVIDPQVAIAYGRNLPTFVERSLENKEIQVLWTARDGAITWRDQGGFHGYLETKHRNALPWG